MSRMLQDVDLARLSPVQKMDLADLLYDTAQQELEAATNPFTAEQIHEIERRVADDEAGFIRSEPWNVVYARLRRSL